MTDDSLAARVAAVERALTDGDPVADLSDAAETQRRFDALTDDLDTLGERVATAPRRTLDLSLPEDADLTAEAGPPRLTVRTANGAGVSQRIPIEVHVCGDRAELRGDITLVYVATDEGPVVLALRGFIRGDGSRAAHACTTGPRPSVPRPGLRV